MRSSTFESKSLHSQNSHLGHLNLINWSTQIKHIELNVFTNQIEGIKFGTWKNRRLNWVLLTFSYSPKDFKYMHHCKLYCLVLFAGQNSISQTLSFGRCVISQFWNRLYTHQVLFSMRKLSGCVGQLGMATRGVWECTSIWIIIC